MSEKDQNMQDSTVRVRWFMFDVPTLLAIISMIVAGVAGYYNLRNDLTAVAAEAARATTINALQEDRLKSVPLMDQQVTLLKDQVAEAMRRLDRFSEQVSSGLELMRKDINQLTIKQEITADKIDRVLTQQPRQQMR